MLTIDKTSPNEYSLVDKHGFEIARVYSYQHAVLFAHSFDMYLALKGLMVGPLNDVVPRLRKVLDSIASNLDKD